ncbi:MULTISPECIES: hypothetical protein [unclassified Modestobacter]
MAAAPLLDPLAREPEPPVNGAASRAELTDRVRRVLPRLLADHRWPAPQQLPELLPVHVGAVLAERPLFRFDRTASIRIQGAAATYCWNYLPDDAWRLVELPPAAAEGSDEDVAAPLIWIGSRGVVADRIYTGLHRGIPTLAATSWEWAAEWSPLLPAPITAVRVLPLAQQPAARVATADGVTPLAGSGFDTLGGVWR